MPGELPAFAPVESYIQGTAAAVAIKAGDFPLLWHFSIAGCVLMALFVLALSLVLYPNYRSGKSH
jgi:hypothetical protein